MHLRRVVVGAVLFGGVLAVASPAFAHIDPDPTEAQAGSEVSVGFTVEHGCDGSPTVRLDMRLPDGAVSAVPEPPAGWTGSVDADVVTFDGGPLPDDQQLTFRLRVTLPPTPDTTIYFPFVQRCEAGEIRWIDIPDDDTAAELDQPAPAMQLFGPVASTTAPATTAPEPTTTTAAPAASPPTTDDSATTSTDAATTTDSPRDEESTASTGPARDAAADTSDGSSSAGSVVFVFVIVALVGMAAIVVFKARGRRSQ